ncbi:MAG: hypothetical protein U1B77_00575, partial [Dehalococcoidales bacterium]|nr:hypothetical protein [Dehalococcoidales bacterium]
MIKAVFFDWFNTLARYDPPRENIQSQALQEFGINIPPQKIVTGLLVADRNYLEENAVSPVRKRSPAEQDRIFTRYQRTILTEAGINIAEGSDILVKILKRAQQLSQGLTFTLFDDVLPALKLLKARNLVLGLLSNIDKDMSPVCRELELEPYLDF